MIRLLGIISFLTCCVLPAFSQKAAEPASGPSRVEGVDRQTSSPVMDLKWSEVRTKKGNTETVTRVQQGVSDARPFLIEEEKSTKIDDQTTQVTKTSFSVDSSGRRIPFQKVQEEHRSGQNGAENITRTVSTPDLAGRFSIVRQETETRTPKGPGEWTTSTSIMLPDINGDFRQVQAVEEIARDKSPGVKEIRSMSSTLNENGTWTPVERRELLTEERKDSSISEREEIYRLDFNGRLTLAERERRNYRKDAAGREYWTTETYGGKEIDLNPSDKLALARKVEVVREVLPDGSERTVQRVSDRNIVDSSRGMELVEETVTLTKPVGGGVKEVSEEVRRADGNGSMKVARTSKMRVTE